MGVKCGLLRVSPLPPETGQPSPLKRLPPVRPQPPTPEGELSAPPLIATGVSLTSFTAAQPPGTADRMETLEARVRELEARSAKDAASADDVSPVESFEEPIEVGADTSLFARWKHGLDLESKNKDFRVHIGGRTQYDNSFFANDPDLTVPPAIGGIGPQHDSFQFRRGRLRIEGTMYENFDFAAEYDFVNTLAPASPSSGQPVVACLVLPTYGTPSHTCRESATCGSVI